MHRARLGIKLNTRHTLDTIQASRRAVSLRHPPHERIQWSVPAAVRRLRDHTSAAGKNLTRISIHNVVRNILLHNVVLNRKNVLVQTLHRSPERPIRSSRAHRVRNRLHTNRAATHLHATDLTARLHRNARIPVSLLQQGANRCARIQALVLQCAATIDKRHLGCASKTLIVSRQRLSSHQAALDSLHLVGSQKTRRKTLHVNTARVWSHIDSLKTEILTPIHRLQLQRRNLLSRPVTHNRAHSISNRSHRHQRRTTNSRRRRQTNAKKLRRTSRRKRPRINTRCKVRVTKHCLAHTITPGSVLDKVKRRELAHGHTLITHQRSSQHTPTRAWSSSQRLDHIPHRSHIRPHDIRANTRAIHTLTKRQHRAIIGRATKQHRHVANKRILLTRKPIPQQRDNLVSHAPTLTRHRAVVAARRRTHRTIRALRLRIRRSHARRSHRRSSANTGHAQPSSQERETSTHSAPTLHNTQGTLLSYKKHVTA